MKRILILSLAAGLLSVGTPALLAEVSTNAPVLNGSQTTTQQQRQMERRRLMKLIGLTPKELKGLTAEEKRARIKEATDQKIAELQKKQADGTITTDEKSDLAFLQERPKHHKAKAATDN